MHFCEQVQQLLLEHHGENSGIPLKKSILFHSIYCTSYLQIKPDSLVLLKRFDVQPRKFVTETFTKTWPDDELLSPRWRSTWSLSRKVVPDKALRGSVAGFLKKSVEFKPEESSLITMKPFK